MSEKTPRKPKPRPPAKRPAAAPEVVYVVVANDGWTANVCPTRKQSRQSRDFWDSASWNKPFRIVRYRLDQPPRGAARKRPTPTPA